MSLTENLDKAIKDIEVKFEGGLSNTSTKKFNDLSVAISAITGLPEDDIYITSVYARPSNTWNRLSQGKPLSRHYTLGVCIASPDGVNGVLAPLGSFIGAGNVHYDSIAVIAQGADGAWKIKAIATNAKDMVSVKCQDQYAEAIIKLVNVVANPLQEVVNRAINPEEAKNSPSPNMSNNAIAPLQLITYGAPGTGKSFNIDKIVNDKGCVHFRTTFHPDSDYASFVGCYKPIVKEYDRIVALGKKIENAELDAGVPDELRKERKIEYTFVEQAFTKAYVAAWKNKASAIANGGQAAEPVYLIIEEINRGNCAQVFGDIFQLLDREGGFSKYPICADDDLHRHLEGVFKGLDFGSQYAKVQTGEELVLPDNLYIWATMNTSDQSLFPMDSAFKRRWDWEYVPISEGVDENTKQKFDWNIVVKDVEKQPDGTEKEITVLYSWWQFLQIINTKIYHLTDSEDKELGYFFAKPDSAEGISAKLFVNKVVFYLWTDVYKNYGVDNIFKGADNGATTEEEKAKGVPFRRFFNETGKNANTGTLKNFFKAIGLKAVEGGGRGATALPDDGHAGRVTLPTDATSASLPTAAAGDSRPPVND